MRSWGTKSTKVYDTIDPRLQDIMDYVLHNVADVSLLYGHRNEALQHHLFVTGKSQLDWPDSWHNLQPSRAVDFQPYPRPEREVKLWAGLAYVAGRAIEYARTHGWTLRWGGDWNRDGDLTNQDFDDLFHLELVIQRSGEAQAATVHNSE